jgi:hypothetical protein
MSNKIQLVEDDLFISVRNVMMLKSEIKQIEEMMPGCKLVPDTEVDLIYTLDREYKKVRASGKEVGKIQIGNDLYFPVQIKVASPVPQFTGNTIDGRIDRPAWFRLRKAFVVK